MKSADTTMLDADVREKLARSSTCNISNCLLKRGLKNTFLLRIHAVAEHQPVMVGRAFTVRFIPAREDMDSMALYARDDSLHRRAIEECPPGAVLVFAAGGDHRAAIMGDMMALRLKVRGVAGVLTDGGYRDVPGIRDTGLPCFQHQSSGPATPIWLHPVEFNTPVGCAGVAIYPGDVIVGDGEGVVVIPQHLTEEVAEEAAVNADYERFAAAHVRNGRSIFGLFPATEESQKEYQQWLADGRPSQDKTT